MSKGANSTLEDQSDDAGVDPCLSTSVLPLRFRPPLEKAKPPPSSATPRLGAPAGRPSAFEQTNEGAKAKEAKDEDDAEERRVMKEQQQEAKELKKRKAAPAKSRQAGAALFGLKAKAARGAKAAPGAKVSGSESGSGRGVGGGGRGLGGGSGAG